MFDQVKDQIKGYLPEKLSPVVSAFVVGTITFVIVALLLSAEVIRPGITDLVPPVILQMVILSFTTFLAGIATWVIRSKKKIVVSQADSRIDNEHIEKYFNYYMQSITDSYKVLERKKAIYDSEIVYVPTGNIMYPAVMRFAPLIPTIKIRIVELSGYKPIKDVTLESLKKWRTDISLQTD
ncbi:hypothetical protein HY468_00960, partial [Candidatus Roizmanbacteria bacterium]|nr:hypothetical protein [Candidatus Roizmanbacteria bacterium]